MVGLNTYYCFFAGSVTGGLELWIHFLTPPPPKSCTHGGDRQSSINSSIRLLPCLHSSLIHHYVVPFQNYDTPKWNLINEALRHDKTRYSVRLQSPSGPLVRFHGPTELELLVLAVETMWRSLELQYSAVNGCAVVLLCGTLWGLDTIIQFWWISYFHSHTVIAHHLSFILFKMGPGWETHSLSAIKRVLVPCESGYRLSIFPFLPNPTANKHYVVCLPLYCDTGPIL